MHFEMRYGTLVNCIAYGLALATSAGSDLKPRVALDIGHSIKQPGAYSARGVGEYYFNQHHRRSSVAIPEELR